MLASKPAVTQADRRKEAERRLLNAAIRLLVDKGYDRFTLAEVGQVAGYSRGLPAHYYGKKEDLLSELARFIVDNYRKSGDDVDHVEPGLPRLVARIRKYTEGVGSRPNRALNVLISEASFRPQLKRVILDLNERGTREWETEIQAGITLGNIRADANVNAVAAAIYAFLRGQSTFVAVESQYDKTATMQEFIEIVEARLAPKT